MFRLKRFTILVLLTIPADGAWAQEWMNELLVHRTPSFTVNAAESCLACHSGEKMRAIANGAHGDSENPLTPYGQHECESCHGRGSIHVSRAHGGKGFPPLTAFGHERGAATRDEQVEACLNCHADTESGIEVRPFRGTVHDKSLINCSSCHQVHVETDPVLERGFQAEICLACHMAQKDGHRKVGNRVPDFSRMGCAGCHRVHRVTKSGDKGAEQ